MTLFLLNVLLALAWTALTGELTATNMVIGFLLGYGTLWMARRADAPSGYFKKARQVIKFAFFFLWELLKANLRVTYDILTPRHRMRPAIIAVPLDAKTDMEISFLANLITLTPGTLSLEVSNDRRVLFIHAMYVTDADQFRRDIKRGLEQRLLEVLR
ncbi:MAG: Na+/H+ antiporter subunit E [Candidatus Abyssobacteria bacterium SURF_17]|jgi:multicomponent Na+:H+ antiporter subunit E|uniref:Na+/H+ antiporter subunit E n=1 Tax=Candidatus Abyssobacteria bacterium SURF_17 TaxID=2093361 RepID=A0A419F7R4_9BACT|nr:MAG: Na+/H+ antiporter subunit E [Candidatus Abyssubacteria bacterium SURF_17]